MVRRSTNSHALAKRALPHVAIIDCEDPRRPEDRDELDAQCLRITNGQAFYRCQRRNGSRYVHVVHFGEPHQARALEDWVWRTRFTQRPAPNYGPPEERAALAEAAVVWGFLTGAIRRVVQAFRHEMGGSLTRARKEALHTTQLYKMTGDEKIVMEALVLWASQNHPNWFHGHRAPSVLPFECVPVPSCILRERKRARRQRGECTLSIT